MKDLLQDIKYMDLTLLAHKYGYTEIVKGKITSSWVNLKNPNTNDNIRIRTKPLPMVFTNNSPSLDQDKGDIINFVINRLDGNISSNTKPTKEQFKEAFNKLKAELGYVNTSDNDISFQKKEINKNEDSNQRIKLKIKNLSDDLSGVNAFFELKRNINPNVLKHPYFIGRIKSSPVQMGNNFIINNAAFLKKDINTLKDVGFTSYYFSSKQNVTEKRITTLKNIPWSTNIFPDSKNIIIGESELDCIAHFEINKPKNAVYIAMGGGLSEEKLNYLKILYQNINSIPKTLTSITDNDQAGFHYDLKMAIYFNNLFSRDTIEIQQNSKSNKIIIHSNNAYDINSLNENMKKALKIESQTDKHLNKINIVQTKDFLIIEFDRFKKEGFKNYLEPLVKFLFEQTPINFYNHKSKLKDWNDDLKSLKNQLPKKKNKLKKI